MSNKPNVFDLIRILIKYKDEKPNKDSKKVIDKAGRIVNL